VINRGCKGFTLIEMLIAMTLLSIMVVLLFSSLKIAADSWNASEARMITINRKAVVYQFFKRHLTTIRPVFAATPTQNSQEIVPLLQVFQGNYQTMQFVASLPMSAARKGLQLFQITSDPDRPANLIVALSPFRSQIGEGATPAQPPEKVVLIHAVKEYHFNYFGSKEEGGPAVWNNDWENTDHLPQLIRVTIQLEDGDYWPDMIFPLKINGSVLPNALPGNPNQVGGL
jgi:general secretion pathway protein J